MDGSCSSLYYNSQEWRYKIMMLKITERCTMGCSHCLNRAIPDGDDMTEDVLLDSLDFIRKNTVSKTIIISGGEPTEHRNFDNMMHLIIDYANKHRCFLVCTMTTNGEAIIQEPEKFKQYVKAANFGLYFQISTDSRYYPRSIPNTHSIYNEKTFEFVPNCVTTMYPIGRALDNNLPWNPNVIKSCKCFNVRALSKQLSNVTLADIDGMLAARGYFCTPHISVDGSIKLGESDLCPVCASIYDAPKEIIRKIQAFKCSKCEHIDKNLPSLYRQFL